MAVSGLDMGFFAGKDVLLTGHTGFKGSWLSRILIDAGAKVTGYALEPPTDLDWVKFDAVAGAVYTIRTDNLLGSTDTYLTLYDTDGTTLLAYNDDINPGVDRRSRIEWRAPASGRYYARVRDFYQSGAHGCLAYDLILTGTYRNYLPLIMAPPPPGHRAAASEQDRTTQV